MKKTNHENVFHFIRSGMNVNVCMPIQMTTIHEEEGMEELEGMSLSSGGLVPRCKHELEP